jgi:hypothetical protein
VNYSGSPEKREKSGQSRARAFSRQKSTNFTPAGTLQFDGPEFVGLAVAEFESAHGGWSREKAVTPDRFPSARSSVFSCENGRRGNSGESPRFRANRSPPWAEALRIFYTVRRDPALFCAASERGTGWNSRGPACWPFADRVAIASRKHPLLPN